MYTGVMQAALSTTASCWGGVCWKWQDLLTFWLLQETQHVMKGLGFFPFLPQFSLSLPKVILPKPLHPLCLLLYRLSPCPNFQFPFIYPDIYPQVKSPQQGERLVEIKPSLSWTSLKTLFCVPFWSPLSLTQLGAHMGNSVHSMDQLRHWSIGQTTILVNQKEPS